MFALIYFYLNIFKMHDTIVLVNYDYQLDWVKRFPKMFLSQQWMNIFINS